MSGEPAVLTPGDNCSFTDVSGNVWTLSRQGQILRNGERVSAGTDPVHLVVGDNEEISAGVIPAAMRTPQERRTLLLAYTPSSNGIWRQDKATLRWSLWDADASTFALQQLGAHPANLAPTDERSPKAKLLELAWTSGKQHQEPVRHRIVGRLIYDRLGLAAHDCTAEEIFLAAYGDTGSQYWKARLAEPVGPKLALATLLASHAATGGGDFDKKMKRLHEALQETGEENTATIAAAFLDNPNTEWAMPTSLRQYLEHQRERAKVPPEPELAPAGVPRGDKVAKKRVIEEAVGEIMDSDQRPEPGWGRIKKVVDLVLKRHPYLEVATTRRHAGGMVRDWEKANPGQ